MATKHERGQDLLQCAFDFFGGADEALRDEISSIRRTEARAATAVSDGQRAPEPLRGETPCSRTRYTFRTSAHLPVRVDERVQCNVDGVPPIRATVLGQGTADLTLDLEADLGPHIPAATVQRDAAWLESALRRLLAGLADRVRRGQDTGPFCVERALAVHRPASADVPDGFVAFNTYGALGEALADALNEEQLRAVDLVLQQPVAFIAGPPGTGKTSTVAASVATLVERGQRVLVVTPSNDAADVVIAKLLPWLADHPLVARGLVQRVGTRVTAHLTPEHRALCVPATIAERIHDEYDAVADFLKEQRSTAAAICDGDTKRWDRELAAIAVERHELTRELARNCHVTVTPIANVYLRPELWRQYDAVIVEESSQVSLPALAVASGLARTRIVIAGDPQQLGPVVHAETPVARAVLGDDAFRLAGVDASLAVADEPPYVVALREQYRMPRTLCTVVSDMFYAGTLRTAHRRATLPVLPGVDHPLVLVDTTRLEPTIPRGSRANAVHAAVVATLVDAISWHARSQRNVFGETPSIGVLTLYRDQVACLARTLEASGCSRPDLVSTVHRAQGAEVDVAIIDLCDAPGAAVTFLRAAQHGDDGARLLNVALSRPRRAVIVVAPVHYLERAGGAVVRALLARLKQDGHVVDAAELPAFVPCAAYAVAHTR